MTDVDTDLFPLLSDIIHAKEIDHVRRTPTHRHRRRDPDNRSGHHDRSRRDHAVDPPQTPLTATVLIPCHNEAVTLPLVLAALQGQDYPLDDIIVVADTCTDRTADIARDFGCTVIETSYGDKASNQNAALPLIHTDVVVGFDGDTIPSRTCVRTMIDHIVRDDLDATCAQTYPIQRDGLWIRGRRFAYALATQWWRLCQAKVGRIQVLTGACYVFRTDAIKQVGGFPNGLISADMDVTWALHKNGHRLGYTPAAQCWTWDPPTFREYRAQIRRWAAGYFQNMAKYRRELLNWRSALVVWTALADMLLLFWVETLAVYSLIRGDTRLLGTIAVWAAIHILVTTGLVARVVGIREAVACAVPYTIVNFYNKWVYLCTFVREWILGRRYATWTGRHGHKLVIEPMSPRRRFTVAAVGGFFVAVAAGVVVGHWIVSGVPA